MKSIKTISLALPVFILLLLLFSRSLFAQETNHLPLTKHLKDSLKTELQTMLADDQKYRWMLEFGELDEGKVETYKKMDDKEQYNRIHDVLNHKVGMTTAQADSLGKLVETIDSINFYKLCRIIRQYGFPKKYIPSYKVTTIFLHSPEQLMTNEFFKMLREQVAFGNLDGVEYARVYDKVQSERKLPELYFVNDHYNPATKTFEPNVPVDLVTTNKAREEIGLKKLSDLKR